MTIFEITSVVGLFVGPIASAAIAVVMTDRSHRRETVTARKLDIFRTLMRTRRAQLDPAFVGALNLVEVDFNDAADVKLHFRELFTSYDVSLARLNSESTSHGDTLEVANNKTMAYNKRVYDDRQEKITRLINSMALHLGYEIDQLDVLKRSYLPQKFSDVQEEQETIRKFVIDLAGGKAKLPVLISLPPASTPTLGR